MNNERETLLRISRGDCYAFESLFRAYYDHLYSTAIMYIKMHELAEDIIQQVFLKLWERRSTLLRIDNLENYIFILTRNEILDHLRKQSVRQKYINRIRELFEEESRTPEQYLITKQKVEILQKAVVSLPPQQQQAWRLSREKGLCYEDIATEMGVSLSTVKGHISCALRSIRQTLSIYKSDLYLFLIFGFYF
ncbi:MAG: RNA polymerase sigma-70 factor [Flavitalea sp.]